MRGRGIAWELSALATAWAEAGPGMLAVVRRYELCRDDQWDAGQEAWVLLLENLHSIREPDRVAAWLRTTARREAARTARRGRRECPREPGTVGGRAVPSGEEEALRAERDRTLWRVVQGLPETERRLVELLAHEPAARRDVVALRVGVPVLAVPSLRTRCLRRLRRLLAAEGITSSAL